MINLIIRNIVFFVILLFLQGFILSEVVIGNGWASPYLYILFILLLPVDLAPWIVLIISLFMGVSVDVFYNSPGVHASSCAFLALVRPFVLRSLQPRDGYDTNQIPFLSVMGVEWFLSYAGILTLAHHIWLLFLEAFKLSSFFSTLFKALLSAIFTLLLMFIVQFLFFKRRAK